MKLIDKLISMLDVPHGLEDYVNSQMEEEYWENTDE